MPTIYTRALLKAGSYLNTELEIDTVSAMPFHRTSASHFAPQNGSCPAHFCRVNLLSIPARRPLRGYNKVMPKTKAQQSHTYSSPVLALVPNIPLPGPFPAPRYAAA